MAIQHFDGALEEHGYGRTYPDRGLVVDASPSSPLVNQATLKVSVVGVPVFVHIQPLSMIVEKMKPASFVIFVPELIQTNRKRGISDGSKTNALPEAASVEGV